MTGWLNRVPGLVETWFPGQEGGHALAAVLFGDVNPSGKLPDTLAARREDYPDFGHFPGVKGQVDYAEGIYVGYRHFDKAKIAPLFPFGYGLSYTTFRYGALKLSPAFACAGRDRHGQPGCHQHGQPRRGRGRRTVCPRPAPED